MASGLGLAEDCIPVFMKLKLERGYSYIIYSFSEDSTQIVVEKTSTSYYYDDFLADLPEDECRWAVYDFEHEKAGEGKRVRCVFYSWSPDGAELKDKMRFAASTDALRKNLQGIDMVINATSPDECSYELVSSKCSQSQR